MPASPPARVSPAGRSVYLLQDTSGPHAILIQLDAATDQEVQRHTLAVPSPHQLAFAPDGAILIAGIGHSLAVDPSTLQPLRSLLGGTFSTDGTRLLVYYPGTSTDRPRFEAGPRDWQGDSHPGTRRPFLQRALQDQP